MEDIQGEVDRALIEQKSREAFRFMLDNNGKGSSSLRELSDIAAALHAVARYYIFSKLHDSFSDGNKDLGALTTRTLTDEVKKRLKGM